MSNGILSSDGVLVSVSFSQTVHEFIGSAGHDPEVLRMRAAELERAVEAEVTVDAMRRWESGSDMPATSVRRRVVAFILREAGFEAA